MINLVLFGPPGAGKGTQSKRLVDKYGLFHVSTGDLFRAEIASRTALGLQIETLVSGGALVADSITIRLLQETVRKHRNTVAGFLFDGFPRTRDQAVALDDLLHNEQMVVDLALLLDVPEQELTHRILRRKQIENRADDEAEKLKKRLRVFFEETTQAFPFYKQKGKLFTVSGLGTEEEVFDRLCNAIDHR